jgi:16S rRNA (guanine527-N7)-methyltransferase
LSIADDAEAAQARAALERLLDEAPAIAAGLPTTFLDAVQHFVSLLLSANRRLNLTRITAPDAVARLHLLDALAALPILDRLGGHDAVDLGSGGGLPAVPLALARPELHWTLVDSVGKKAATLRDFTEALGMGNVTVIAERIETLGRDPRHRERHALVTARACAPLPVLVELALPLLARAGSLVAWKGPLDEQDPELRSGRTAIDKLGGGDVQLVDPGLAALGGHRFVIARKEGATPSRFPRRPGEASRRPLG